MVKAPSKKVRTKSRIASKTSLNNKFKLSKPVLILVVVLMIAVGYLLVRLTFAGSAYSTAQNPAVKNDCVKWRDLTDRYYDRGGTNWMTNCLVWTTSSGQRVQRYPNKPSSVYTVKTVASTRSSKR
jgi:hypothetical protein